jgi:hypothetical protein
MSDHSASVGVENGLCTVLLFDVEEGEGRKRLGFKGGKVIRGFSTR